MNIQAIIFSFILAIGAVMICVTSRTVDDDHELSNKSNDIVKIIGIVMTSLGGLGYLITIAEVVVRGHRKLKSGHLKKLEQEEHARRDTARKETLRQLSTQMSTQEVEKDKTNFAFVDDNSVQHV